MRPDHNATEIGRALAAVTTAVLVAARLMMFIVSATEPIKLPDSSFAANATANRREARGAEAEFRRPRLCHGRRSR